MQKVRFWDPEHWRFRAEETRTVADQMTHEEARGMALKLSSRNVRHEPHTTHVSGSQRRSSRLVATAAEIEPNYLTHVRLAAAGKYQPHKRIH